jgi:hypothetical protein
MADVSELFKFDNRLIVEAIEQLFAAEAAIQNCIDRNEWKKAIHQVNRRQENLDHIIYEVGKCGIGKMGNITRIFIYAVSYRVIGAKLYKVRTPTSRTKEYKRYWYRRRDEVRQTLAKLIVSYHDHEAEANGKYVLWKLMLRRGGRAYEVVTSRDRQYIIIEYNDALRKIQKGEMYFISKEYREVL